MPNRPYVNTNPNDVTEYIVIVDGAGQAVNGDGGLIESYTPDGFKMKFFCFCDQYGNEYNAFVTSVTPGDGLDTAILPDGSTQVSLKPAQLAELGGLFAKTPIEGQYVVGLDESGNLIFESIGDIDLPGGSTGTGPIVLQNAPTINNPVIQVPGVYGGQWTGGVLNGMTSHNEIADSGSYTNSSMKGTKADGLTLTAPPGVTVVDGVTQHPGGGIDFWTASGIDFSSDSNHLLRSVLLDSWGLPKVSASATVPTLLTRRTDLTTGLGGPVGELDLIISGVSQLKADNTGLRNKAGDYIVSPSGMRNRIINGDMRIDQRHAGGIVTVTGGGNNPYGVDRWIGFNTIAGAAFSMVQTALAWAPATYADFGIQLTCTTAVASIPVGVLAQFFQQIEGTYFQNLKWGTVNALPVTISFSCAASVAGDYFMSLFAGGNPCYVHKFTLAAGVTTKVSFTVPGCTTGTWQTDSAHAAVALRLNLGAGSSFVTSTFDAWIPGNFVAGPSQVNIMGVAGQGFWLTDVQVEAGSVATPFDRRPYAQELYLCKRYYETNIYAGNPVGDAQTRVFYSGVVGNANIVYAAGQFEVEKRINQMTAFTFYKSTGLNPTNGLWGAFISGGWTDMAATQLNVNNSKTWCVQGSCSLPLNSAVFVSGGWAADCEF